MRGIIHEVYPDSTKGEGVGLSNQDNPYYDNCIFETREEVDEFIKKLVKVRNEVFGKERRRE